MSNADHNKNEINQNPEVENGEEQKEAKTQNHGNHIGQHKKDKAN